MVNSNLYFSLGLALLKHSFSIIAVFKHQVFLRSTFLIIFLSFLNNLFDMFSIFFSISLVFLNLLIFVISLRENEKALLESHQNISDKVEITH